MHRTGVVIRAPLAKKLNPNLVRKAAADANFAGGSALVCLINKVYLG